jgi:hypothetical protein
VAGADVSVAGGGVVVGATTAVRAVTVNEPPPAAGVLGVEDAQARIT